MTPWEAAKDPLRIMLVILIPLGLIQILLSSGFSNEIIPAPDTTAAEFVQAVGAHRMEGAKNQLSEGMNQQNPIPDLDSAIEAINQQRGGIDSVDEVSSEENGDTATATVSVQFEDQTQVELSFPLVKENYIWKVNSIVPIVKLAR